MPPLVEDSRPPLHSGSPPENTDFTWSPSTREGRSIKYPISPIAERGVQFNPLPLVIEIPNVDDLSKEELESVWYTEDHVNDFIKEATEVALRMSRRTLRRGDCGRGVEELTAKGFHMKMGARAQGLLAVLSEQLRQQKEEMVRDGVKVAQAYAAVSKSSAIHAQNVAAVDALEAQMHRNENPYSEDPLEEPFDCWALFSPIHWFRGIGSARVAPDL
jgi:uncharacterized protein YcgL (UPF0745 family)